MNRATEDYIKLVYELTYESKQDLVTVLEISKKLDVSIQSANEMVKKLEKFKLLNFYPYKGVSLTEEGLKTAVRMIRSHRIWEVFLKTKLNVPWDEVHRHAELLEHSSLEEINKKLYEYLGSPKYCIHGNPIPSFDDEIPNFYSQSLNSFKTGDKVIIKRVLDIKDLLNYLDSINLKINDTIIIKSKDKFTKTITIQKENNLLSIPENIVKMIFGERKDIKL